MRRGPKGEGWINKTGRLMWRTGWTKAEAVHEARKTSKRRLRRMERHAEKLRIREGRE